MKWGKKKENEFTEIVQGWIVNSDYIWEEYSDMIFKLIDDPHYGKDYERLAEAWAPDLREKIRNLKIPDRSMNEVDRQLLSMAYSKVDFKQVAQSFIKKVVVTRNINRDIKHDDGKILRSLLPSRLNRRR